MDDLFFCPTGVEDPTTMWACASCRSKGLRTRVVEAAEPAPQPAQQAPAAASESEVTVAAAPTAERVGVGADQQELMKASVGRISGSREILIRALLMLFVAVLTAGLQRVMMVGSTAASGG